LTITHVIGDATEIQVGMDDEYAIIAHVCNNVGAWGAGFVVPLGKKYPAARNRFIIDAHAALPDRVPMGTVQFELVEPGVIVANMIAMNGVASGRNPRPLQMDQLAICLIKLNAMAERYKATVHMPRIGAGLAGGDWQEIASLLTRTMTANVVIYTLPVATAPEPLLDNSWED
jgi:O-acetyl-ADP-ribose deacetylase (regulator of RNase III)